MSDEILCHILSAASEVFECPVSGTDNFFDLGGDSPCAIELGGRLEEVFNIKLDISDVFASNDMADLARVIAKYLETGEPGA